jgi:glycosyltransferase involved in cell wall biosynthesis
MSEPEAALKEARPLFIAEIEQLGGAERSFLALSGWLHRRGLPHYFLTYRDGCQIAQYATHPVEVVALEPVGGVRAKVAALKQHFAARGESPLKPLLSGYQPALHATLAGLRGTHCIMHDSVSLFGDESVRTLKGRIRMAVSNAIIGWGLRSGGKTIVTSEFLRAECLKDFGVHAELARMGGFGRSGAPVVRPVEGELRMLSVCRIEGNKRIDWILRSLAALEMGAMRLSSRVNWQLDLAGKGPLLGELTQMAAELGIADRVHFHGFVPDASLAVMYDRAHLFLMPAIQGYGIPAIESLQAGIPVLLHRESGVSDLLLDTPWATVLYGDESTMLPALTAAIDGVMTGAHDGVAQPALPTEDSWAERVAMLCGWC